MTKKFGFTLAECATHVDNSNGRRKFAFTLAEVLITLGIIGVVAAITMPVLIQNQTNRETEVKLQKFYSVFNQAIKRSIVDNAEMSTWDTSLPGAEFDDKYIIPYLQVVEVVENTPILGSTTGNKYILADGTAFANYYNGGIIFYPKKPKDCPKNNSSSFGICSFYFGSVYFCSCSHYIVHKCNKV